MLMVCLGKEQRSFIFEIAPKYCISESFVDYEDYSISSKGFLPTVVDIMVIWIKFTHSNHFSSQFLKCQCFCHLLFDHFQFTLIHGPDIPSSYAVLFTFTTRDIHLFLGVVSIFLGPLFLLELFLCSSSVAYWTPTDLGTSSFSVISFHGVLKARKLKWFAIPFSSGPFLSELSTMTCPSSPGHLPNPGIKLMSSALIDRKSVV